jgi:hypothetical protein
MENASLLKRWLSLAAALAAVWVFVFAAGPALRDSVPEMRRMAAFVDETGIETGAFYYTDVEIVGHADINARSTMEYLPRGPEPSRAD